MPPPPQQPQWGQQQQQQQNVFRPPMMQHGEPLAQLQHEVGRLRENMQKEQAERDNVIQQLEDTKSLLGPVKETKLMAEAQLQETTELNEEVRQALQGLHEIGDYAGLVRDIENQVADTRGAVESMMDMLEKTLTIKDGNALLDDHEARVDEQIANTTEQVQNVEGELSDVRSEMATVAADLMKVSHEVSRHGEANKLRLEEQIGGVESKVAEVLRTTTTRIQSLETRVEKREQRWKTELDDVKKGLETKLQAQAKAHSQELDQLRQSMVAAQKKTADDLIRRVADAERATEAGKRASESRCSRLDGLCSTLDGKINSNHEALEQKLGTVTKEADDVQRALGMRCESVEKTATALQDIVRQLQTDVQTIEPGFISKLEQEIQSVEEQLSAKVAQADAQMVADMQEMARQTKVRDNEIDEHLAKLRTDTTKVQEDQSQIKKDVREQLQQTTGQLEQHVQSLQQQMDKVSLDVKTGEADVATRFEDVIQQVNTAIQGHSDKADQSLAMAETSISKRLDEQDSVLEQQRKQDQGKLSEIQRNIHEHQLKYDSALSALDAGLKKAQTDLAKSIADEAKKADKQSKSLEAKTAKSVADHEKRLDDQKRGWEDARMKLEKDTERKLRELEAKIAAEHGYADELRRVGDRKIEEAAAVLDKKLGKGLSDCHGDAENLKASVVQLNDEVSKVRDGLHGLVDSTTSRFEDVDRACDNLGMTVQKNATEIDGQLNTLQGNAEALERQIGDVAENAQLRLSDEINGVTARIDAVGNAVDSAHQAVADAGAGLSAKIEEGHTEFAKMCTELEKKMRAENSAQDERLELVRESITTHLDKLDQKHAGLTATTDQRFADGEKRLGAEVTGLKQSMAESASVFDKRMADQKLTMQQETKRLTDACNALEKRATQAARDVETKAGTLDKEIKSNHKQVTQRCEAMAKTVASESASLKSRVDTVAQEAAAGRSRIEGQLTTTTNEHHQKILDMNTAVAQAASEAKAQIAKQEQDLEAVVGKIDKSAGLLSAKMEDNLNTALAAIAGLETKLTTAGSSRDVRIRELNGTIQQVEAQAAEDSKRLEEAAAQNLRDVQSQQKHLHDSIMTENKRIESTFDSKMGAQNTLIANEKAHFEKLLSAAEKKLEARCASLEGIQAGMSKDIKATETRIFEARTQLDGRISSVDSIHSTRVEKMQTHFEDVCLQLENKLTSDSSTAHALIDQRLADLSTALADQSSNLESKVTELRVDHDGRLAELKNAIEHNYSELDLACKTLDKKAGAVTSALDERVRSNHQHFTNEFAKLDTQSAMKDDQHDAKLDVLSQEMSAQGSKLTTMLQTLQTNLESKDVAQDARMDEQQEKFADLVQKLDAKLSEKDAEQDAELHQIATTAIKHHTEFKESILALDAKLGDNAAEWKKDATHFTAVAEDLDREMHAEQTENIKRIHEVKDRMAKIDANWHEAERKLAVEAQAQAETIKANFHEEAQRLATNLSTAEKQIDTRIKAEHNLVLSKCTELEKKTSDIQAALDIKTHHLDAVLSEYKEHMGDTLKGITHTVDQHYQHLTETDKLTDDKLKQKCEELAHESSSIRKYFDEVCLNLEFKFTEKNLTQDNKLSELEQREQENYSQVTGMCVDLESRLNNESIAVKRVSDEHFSHFTKVTNDLDQSFTQRLQNQGEHLTEVCRGLSTTMSTQYAALDEKFTAKAAGHDELMSTQYQHLTAATEKADQKVDQKVEEMRQSVASTIEHLTAINSSLEQKIKERQTTMETKFTHKNEEQDIRIQKSESNLVNCNNELGLLNDFLSPLDERVNQHYAHFEEVLNEINSKFLAWSAPMEVRIDDAIRAHETDRSQLSERITEVTNTFTGRWQDLGAAQKATDRRVDENNSKATEFMKQLDKTAQEMHAHFTEICATLDVKLVNQVKEIQEQMRSEQERFVGVCASLDEKFTVATEATDNRVASVSEIVTENHRQCTQLYDGVDKKFGGIVAGHETRIANLSSALNDSHASLKALLVKLEADLKAEVNTRAEKTNSEHDFFTVACSKIDEKHSLKTTELSEKYDDLSRLVTQKTQGLAQANDALEQKLLSNVHRIDATIKTVPEEIARNRQEAAGRSDKIEKLMSETTTRVEAKAEMDRQHFTERCDSLDKNVMERATALSGVIEDVKSQLQSTSSAAMSAFKSMHSEHKQRLDKQAEKIEQNAESASARHDDLHEKLLAEITTQTERSANQSKHFAAIVANVEQKFGDQQTTLGQRVAELEGSVSQFKSQMDSQFKMVGENIAEEKKAQIARVNDTADAFRSIQTAMAKQNEEHFATVKQEHRSLLKQCAADKQELANVSTRIERHLESQGEEAQQRLDAQRTDLVAMLTESDRRFQTAVSEHGGSIAKLSDHVDANIQRLLTAHAALESSFDEERATQATRIEDHKKFFEEMFDSVKSEFNVRSVAEAERVNELIEREHEHFTDALVSLDRKMTNETSAQTTRIEELNESMGEHSVQTRDVMSALDEKFTQGLTTQKESIEKNHQESIEAMAGLDEKYHGITQSGEAQANQLANEIGTALDQQKEFERDLTMLKGKNDAQDERVDDLSTLMDQHHTHFTDVCAMLDTKLRDAANVSAAEIERAQKEVMEQCMQVDAKLSAEKDSTSERLENHHRHFTQVFNQVDASSESRASAAETRIAETLTTMERNNVMFTESLDAIDKKLLDSVAAQEGRMRDQNKHFADVCAGLEKKGEDNIREAQEQFSQQCGQIDLKLVEWTREFDARLESTTSTQNDHHRHFTAVCTKLDMQLGEEAEALKSHLVNTQEHLGDSITQVERRLGQSQTEQEARYGDLGAAMEAQENRFTDTCGKLDRVMTEQVAALQEKIEHEHAHAEELNMALDRKFCDRLDDQDGRMDEASKTTHEHHRYFTSICEQLDRKFSDAATAQREKLQEMGLSQESAQKQLTQTLNTKVTETLKSHDERLSSQHTQFTEVLSEQDRKFSEACVKLDAKVSEELRLRDAQAKEDRARFSELCAQTSRAAAEELTKTNTKFTDVCIGLDEKFSKAAGELKATLQSDFSKLDETLTASSTGLKNKLSAEMKGLDEKMTDSIIGLDQKTGVLMDEQASRVEKLQKYLTDENAKLRQQLNSRSAELDTKIGESCDAVSTTLLRRTDETETKLADLATSTTQRAFEIERASKQAVEKLTSGLSNAERKAAADLQRDVGILQEKLEVRMSSLEKRQTDLKEKAAEDQDALETRTRNDLGRLGTSLGALETKHEALAEEQTRTSRETSRRIDQMKTELDNKIDLQNQLHTALEADTGRNDKKRKEAIEDVKRSTEGKLDAIKATVEVNLDQRIKTVEEKLRPLETGVLAGQKASTDVTLVKMDVEELKGLASMIAEVEDKIEDMKDSTDSLLSEIQVDVQVLQATQQAL